VGVIGSVVAGATVYQVIRQQMKHQREGANQHKNLSFGGQLQVSQHVPGRLRVYSPLLKHKEKGQNLLVQLSRIDGINKVSTEERTGSLLILYCADKIEGTMLVGAVARLLGLGEEGDLKRTSKIMQEVHMVNRSVNYAVLDRSKGLLDIKTLVPLAFLGLGIKTYLRNGTLGMPPAFTLFYWAYNSFGLNDEVCK
jgi:hypothetical protein